MYSLRPYQKEAVEAVYRHLREKDSNPCVVIPTAGGKSLCLAQVAKDAVEKWGGRVCILAHVKELVEQNAGKLKSICPELKVGVYSAGLDSRDTKEKVVVAGIQSIYNKMDLFEPFDLVMIDEAHLIPPDGEGRYRTFLAAAKAKNTHVRLIGWTATPFRESGLICKPENLLNEVCYEIGVKDLIDQGYISKITAKCGSAKANLDHLHIRGGEFIADEVEEAMGDERVVVNACREIVSRTAERKTCLIFCTSVAHCKKVAKLIAEMSGEECAVVTGETPPEERARTISRLRGEKIDVDLFGNGAPPLRYCCNVGVMTTGTDIPNIDTVVLLRPTASPVLYVQAVGRGFRLSPQTGKTECLVLDFGRNVERFGPIDMIDIKDPKRGTGEALAKECPNCHTYVRLPIMLCPECGYAFPHKEKEKREHEEHAANAAILSGEVTVEKYPVAYTDYCVWTKRNAPPGTPKTVRVTYFTSMPSMVGETPLYGQTENYSEWLCPEHTGYARQKFEKWWRSHTLEGTPLPRTAEEVVEHSWAGMLRETEEITVKRVAGSRYPEITGARLGGFRETEQPVNGEEDFDDIPF